MAETLQFLVVDFHAESRYLLVKTIQRKFPGALVHEVDDVEGALQVARSIRCGAAVAHRTFDVSGADLVRLLRGAAPDMPIIMVSGMDRAGEARAAGAKAFLRCDEWLRLGAVAEQVMAAAQNRTRELV